MRQTTQGLRTRQPRARESVPFDVYVSPARAGFGLLDTEEPLHRILRAAFGFGPILPLVPKELDRVLGPLAAVPAREGVRGAALITPPTDALRVRWPEHGKLHVSHAHRAERKACPLRAQPQR